MIPQRVKLSGFLSYKDEQEVHFDGVQLWMLTGANGSGKSSIFDALTFALFGCHRGGSQNSGELINRGSASLAVEFDFLLDGARHRIKRTLRQLKQSVKSTVQVLLHESGDAWQAVSGTDQKTKFDAWIKDKIGLDYETFTSSVLLLQGKAEKLLDTSPSGRAGVLARIVDLERYQKLHAAADEKRRQAKNAVEGVANQLSGVKEVSDEEYAAASANIASAEAARGQTQERIDRLQAQELQSLRWADAQDKLAAARDKLKTAEALLGSAVAIERDHTRLRELRDVFPAINVIVTDRSRIAESQRSAEKLAKERQVKADSRRQIEHALEQARSKLAALKKTLTEDEAKQGKLNAELRELATVLEKVRQAEEAETEVKRLDAELQRFPTDADAVIRNLDEEQGRLAVIAQAIPSLDRLCSERTELSQAVRRESGAKAEADRLLAEGNAARAEADRLQKDLATQSAEREAAAAAAVAAKTLADQARQLAEEFKKLSSEKTCVACGQELTQDHFQKEKKRRDLDAKAADRKQQEQTRLATEARDKEDALAAELAAAQAKLDALRMDFQAKAGEAKAAAVEIEKLTASCKASYFALPENFKQMVSPSAPADWTKTTYPERHELTALRKEAEELEAVRRKLRAATDTANAVRTVRAQTDAARDRWERMKQTLPPGDSAALRQKHTARQSEDTALVNAIKAANQEIDRTAIEVDRQQRALGAVDRDLVEIDGKLNLEESTRKQSQEAIDRAKKTLPAAWQGPLENAGLAERSRWQDECDALAAKGTEAKFTQLQAARGGLDSQRAEIDVLQEEADVFPEGSRRPPAEVKEELAAARGELDRRNAELMNAQRNRGILEEYRRLRAELADQCLALDAEHHRYKRLAELLGRDRLQRHLVRKAERQIVDCANGVLDRLSNGQLYLKIVGSDDGTSADKALDLECANRATGAAAINVAFISGSQRFRVAVSLALGIGQYASRQFRPIESVIIDEGFGCLDRAGRQVMIQELQNLRGHLKSILLVSHQEEFADAFPDGYRFELVDGATRVTRIRK